MSQTVVLKVSMSCSGCAGAVQRALGKMEGIESFDVNLKEQKVTVKSNVPAEAVFETVSKTGKKTSFWEEPAPAPAPETAPAPELAPVPAPTPAPETTPAPVPETAPVAEAPAEAKPAEPVSAA